MRERIQLAASPPAVEGWLASTAAGRGSSYPSLVHAGADALAPESTERTNER